MEEKIKTLVPKPYQVKRSFKYTQKHFHRAKEAFYRIVEQEKPASILDVGCGEGLDSIPLMSLGVKYVGVDPIEGNLQSARQSNPRGDFRLGFIQELPFPDGAFDWVYVCTVWDVLNTVDDMRRGIEECIRVARRRVYSLDATAKPRCLTERYMMIPMHYGLSITRVNYNPDKGKADYLWCIDKGGIK